MTTIDYDARRRTVEEVEEDSLNGLPAPRVSAQSPVVDLEQSDAVEGFELPGEELTAEEPTMSVAVPMRADEFRCSRCFLVYHRSQRVPSIGRETSAASVPDRTARPAITKVAERWARTVFDSPVVARLYGAGGRSISPTS